MRKVYGGRREESQVALTLFDITAVKTSAITEFTDTSNEKLWEHIGNVYI